MILTEIDKSLLIKDFPYIEPFYETIVHKKVYNSDFILAIPYGQKCFVWFTTFKNQNVCVILEINENNNIIMGDCAIAIVKAIIIHFCSSKLIFLSIKLNIF